MIKSRLLICITLFTFACTGKGSEGDNLRKIFPGEPVVPREANRLLIPFPVNNTGIPLLQEKLRQRMITLNSIDHRLSVVNQGEEADIELDITILELQLQPVKTDTLGQVEKKRVRITASIVLKNLRRGTVILRDSEIQSFREYSDRIPPVESDDTARDTALDILAQRITAKVQRGWYTEYLTPEERRK